VGLKKGKDFRFAWQDADGELRVVVIRAEHHEEDGVDRVTVNVSGDGVPLEAKMFSHPDKPVVKTKSRL